MAAGLIDGIRYFNLRSVMNNKVSHVCFSRSLFKEEKVHFHLCRIIYPQCLLAFALKPEVILFPIAWQLFEEEHELICLVNIKDHDSILLLS